MKRKRARERVRAKTGEEWRLARLRSEPCWDSVSSCALTPSASSLTCAVTIQLHTYFLFFYYYSDYFVELRNSGCYCSDPWEHLLGMGLGVIFVNQLIKFDAKSQEDLDKLLVKAKQANERRYFGNIPFLLQNFFHFYCMILIGMLKCCPRIRLGF